MRFVRLGKCKRATAAGHFLIEAGYSFRADGFNHFVEILGILKGFSGDAEGTVGLAAYVSGNFHFFKRLDNCLFHFIETHVLDQHLDNVAGFDRACQIKAGLFQRLIGFRHQIIELTQSLGCLA